MLELFYGIHREQTISDILYTLMATTIIKGIGEFKENQFYVERNIFPNYIENLLSKIKGNRVNNISWQDITELKSYFIVELKKCGFLSKFLFLGQYRNNKFYKYIRENLNLIDGNVKLYIDYNDKNYLDEIDRKIKQIKFRFPESNSFGSFYKDSGDMMTGYWNARNGNYDHERYKYYYSKSGKKIKIK